MTKNLKIALILSICFLVLIRFTPVWQRNPGGLWNLLFYLSIAVLFIWIVIRLIKEIVFLIKQRRNLNLKLFIPIAILSFALFDGMYNPFKIDLERFYGQIDFRACFEGTQNQATFYLKDRNRFEIHWTGVFFYDDYFYGKYKRSGDTLFLDYKSPKPIRFGDTILMDNNKEILISIIHSSDSLKNYVPFYYGYCKGLN
jgi:hypothetical protein